MKGLWFKPSDPTVETVFHAPFTWINSMKQHETKEREWNLPNYLALLHVLWIPLMRGLDFEKGWLIKSRIIN
jgi:hypothetical protein